MANLRAFVCFFGSNIIILGWKCALEEICSRSVDLVILNDATPLLKYQVYLDGILLFSRDDILTSNFMVRALFEYEDMRPYLELTYKRMIRSDHKWQFHQCMNI